MKRFYLVALGTAALAMTFACTKNEDGKEPGGGDPVQLAKPVLKSTTTETSFTITWDAVENAGGYMVKFNGTESPISECTFTQEVEAGSYEVEVKATTADAKKYTDSEYAKITVTVEAGSGPVVTDGTWYGLWEVSSNKTISFDESGTTMLEEPTKKEVEITEGEQDIPYLMLGWSDMKYQDDTYIPGFLISLEGTDFDTGNPDDLGFLSGMQAAAAGSQGEVPTWTAFADIEGQYQFVTGGPYPAFTLDINDDFSGATLIAYEGDLKSGGTFKVLGMDIFGLTEKNVYFYGESWPFNFPAGDFTMKKTANASSASRANVNLSNTIEASAVMSTTSVASAR